MLCYMAQLFPNKKFISLLILLCLSLPCNLWANENKEEVDFVNNPALLSNSFDEYKGMKLETKDELIIKEECAELMNKNPDLHTKCKEFYKNLALSFKVDSSICKNKSKRLGRIKKEQRLVLIDEEGKIRNFIVKNAPFLEGEEYEKCMDNMKWKDSSNFRYGKY